MDQKEEKEVYIEEIQSCVDYPLDDDIDSDIDLQQPDELLDFIKKRNWKKILKEKLMSKACMIVAGIFCVAILLSLVISFIVSYVLICNSPYPDTIMRFDPHLKNTTEMQIGLDDFDSWIDRDAKMNEWIETMNENSKYLDTSLGFIKEQVRKQYNMDVSNCKSHIEYRVREFSNWKDNDGGATMDSKYNSKDINEACMKSIAPGPLYITTSSEKCELDLHECSSGDKYSREGRIFFPKGAFRVPRTCSDMYELYPGDFEDLDSKYMQNPVGKKGSSYWYERKYIGYIKDSKYEITFTLRYSSIDAAQSGVEEAPDSGEWSIRLYTVGDGYTDTWDTDVSKDVLNVYSTLKHKYGKSCL